MKSIGLIYVSRSGSRAEREGDPFLKQLTPAFCVDVSAPPDRPLDEVVREVSATARQLRGCGLDCTIVVSAFLDWEAEGVEPGGLWDPDNRTLCELTSRNASHRMRCIRLMWSVWEHLRGQAKILVTTDRVRISRRSERALETAVSVGRACRMYNWNSNPLVIDDLVMETKGACV